VREQHSHCRKPILGRHAPLGRAIQHRVREAFDLALVGVAALAGHSMVLAVGGREALDVAGRRTWAPAATGGQLFKSSLVTIGAGAIAEVQLTRAGALRKRGGYFPHANHGSC